MRTGGTGYLIHNSVTDAKQSVRIRVYLKGYGGRCSVQNVPASASAKSFRFGCTKADVFGRSLKAESNPENAVKPLAPGLPFHCGKLLAKRVKICPRFVSNTEACFRSDASKKKHASRVMLVFGNVWLFLSLAGLIR